MKPEISAPAWRKSSYSGVNNNCVEAGDLPGAVAVRDSADPHGPALTLAPATWNAFTAKLKITESGRR